MKVKNIIYEDFIQYRKPSMFISAVTCDWKCEREYGDGTNRFCHNSPLLSCPNITISNQEIINNYKNNGITSAIVFGGLEPMDSFFNDILELIYELRIKNLIDDDIVIYTGYNKEEVEIELEALSPYSNIIIKFGRYIPNQESHFDKILGVDLASENQYAEKIC